MNNQSEHNRLYRVATNFLARDRVIELVPPVSLGWFAKRRVRKAISMLQQVMRINSENWAALWVMGKSFQAIADPAQMGCAGVEGGDDVGYGPARILTRAEVAEVSKALASITADRLRTRYDWKAVNKGDIYPQTGKRTMKTASWATSRILRSCTSPRLVAEWALSSGYA